MPRIPPARLIATAVLVALPWLNPFTGGPSSTVWPWLFSATCGCMLAAVARWRPTAGWVRLAGVAAALVAWAALSRQPVQPDVMYLAAGLLLIVLAAGAAQDTQLRRALAAGLLAAAAASAAAGLLQYMGASTPAYPWVNMARTGEAYANLRQPNQFATLCSIGMAVLLWGRLPLPLPGAATLIALLAAGSAASVSRTGLLQGVLLVALAGGWRGSRPREQAVLCTVAACAYGVATFGLPALLQVIGEMPSRTLWSRISGGESCSSRTVLWANVLELVRAHPWLGRGWGELDYAHFMTLYSGARFCEILDNAHSLPLHLAVELGIPAALLSCAGAAAWTWRRRPWSERDPARQLAWAVLALIVLHSLLEYPLWYGPFQIAFGLALGWLLAGPPAPARARMVAAARGSALLLLAMVAYAGWDYWRASQIFLPPEQRRAAWSADPLAESKRSRLFAAHGQFADLTLTPLTRANAAEMAAAARVLLHYSPEPMVIRRLIEAETLLGRTDDAVQVLARFRAAFPVEYEAWRREHAAPAASSPAPRLQLRE